MPVLDHAQADGALLLVERADPRRAADRTMVERAGCMGTKLQQEDAHVVPKLALPDRRGLQTIGRALFPVVETADTVFGGGTVKAQRRLLSGADT